MVNDISAFIEHFHKISKTDDITEVFTCGCCYWFTYILCGRFPQAKMMYDPVINHFVAQIGDKLYDITGDVSDKYDVVSWDDYYDEMEKERIIRDCVNFQSQK